MQPGNTLPLNASGYFSTMAEANLDRDLNIGRRRMGFKQLMRDLGIRLNDGEFMPDWGNRFGAFAEGKRAASQSVASRGFGPSRDMRKLVFTPVRSDIMKQARRARGEMMFENKADRDRRRQILASAARDAAQYGYETRQPKESR